MWPFSSKKQTFTEEDIETAVNDALAANAVQSSFRDNMGKSGGYDYADTLHNVYADYGYPAQLEFSNFWNMYRRFGIARNVIELTPDIAWSEPPTVKANEQFTKDFDSIVNRLSFWQRMKGLDTRQRVGRYAGVFMRVADGKAPSEELTGRLPGEKALVSIRPLYESQLRVLETEKDQKSPNFGQPTMYQFNSSAPGNRDERSAESFSIHPSRVVIAAEGADDGNN